MNMIQLVTPAARNLGSSLLLRRSQRLLAPALPTNNAASLPIIRSLASVAQEEEESDHRCSHSLLILGKPGGGKGTISGKILSDFPQFRHVSTGDELRQHVRNGTELGKEAKKYMDGMLIYILMAKWFMMFFGFACYDVYLSWNSIFSCCTSNSHITQSFLLNTLTNRGGTRPRQRHDQNGNVRCRRGRKRLPITIARWIPPNNGTGRSP